MGCATLTDREASVERPTEVAKASIRDCTSSKRSCGALARHLRTAFSRACGTVCPGATEAKLGIGVFKWEIIVAALFVPWKG